jgi:hypothetical protein
MEGLNERVQELAKRLGAHGPIQPAKISGLIQEFFGSDVNCYPGGVPAACRSVAIFVSLRGREYVEGRRGHLDFRRALERLVQHMQGHCPVGTGLALLVADELDRDALDEWLHNLQEIRNSGRQVVVYLLQGRGNDAIPFTF